MAKFFITQEQVNDNNIEIIGKDVNHIRNVLRKKVNDEIIICNTTNEKDYLCSINNLSKESVTCKIITELEKQVESNVKVSIFQGLPKFDKMELVIQKSVELGAYEIIPVEMKRCIVKLQEKDKLKKIQRWQKISEVACKQCGRNLIPKINPIIKTKNICDLIKEYDLFLVAYENEQEKTIKQALKELKEEYGLQDVKIGVLIGPEGGIAPEEVDSLQNYGAITVSLGKRILRTETVALNVLSVIMYELEY